MLQKNFSFNLVHEFQPELAAVAAYSETPVARREIQRQTRHHAGGTPAHHCRRSEPRTESALPVMLALGSESGRKGEDVDWPQGTVSFIRKKTGVAVIVNMGTEALNLFKDLPAEGMLLPYLAAVRAGDRATEFKSRCEQLGIKGVTLHSTITHYLKRQHADALKH